MDVKVKREIITKCILTWSVSILILSISWNMNTFAYLEVTTWFARAGSLVAIIAAFSEWQLIKRLKTHHKWVQSCSIIHPASPQRLQAEQEIENHYITPLGSIIEKSNILLIFIGTFVWGYGDIFYSLVNA
jgi:hypothetical protein